MFLYPREQLKLFKYFSSIFRTINCNRFSFLQPTSSVRIRSSDKDQLIAELRQQLYDLKNQERDYRGVNDEIFSMDNRYKLLSEEKVRSEMEGRARLDRGMDEIADCRK